jgi:hypothetical protein
VHTCHSKLHQEYYLEREFSVLINFAYNYVSFPYNSADKTKNVLPITTPSNFYINKTQV